MELQQAYDVVIVGSGPAGAGAARALTGSGLKVLIAERDELPRFKMCSGILFPSARKFIDDHFGEIPDHVRNEPRMVEANRVYFKLEDPPVDVPFAAFDVDDGMEKEGINTSRAQLDYWLCSQSDAQLEGGYAFKDVKKNGEGYDVQLQYKGKKVSIKTKYLIGADGASSRVRASAFPGFDDSVHRLPNYEEFYLGEIDLEPGWLHIFLDRRITGYFATVFHDEGKIQVVTGTHDNESVRDYHKAFRVHLEDMYGLVVREKVETHGISLTDMSAQQNYCLGLDNILLVGEAGGFLRGGEGITSSLISGWAAGDAVRESIATGRSAMEHFQELAAEELGVCQQVHEQLTAVMGFNVFKRRKPEV
jgi:flavin-dependent dehydrogenase